MDLQGPRSWIAPVVDIAADAPKLAGRRERNRGAILADGASALLVVLVQAAINVGTPPQCRAYVAGVMLLW